jgi:hypothetical protein
MKLVSSLSEHFKRLEDLSCPDSDPFEKCLEMDLHLYEINAYQEPGLRIRIHLIRIRIQYFMLNTDPDPGY